MSVGGRVRVLVADREPTRLGVRLALEGHAVICAEADDARVAVRAAVSLRPEVCLIGSSIPGGLAAVREISRSVPETAVVMVSDSHRVNDLLDAVRAGAVGYVPAGFDAEQLRRVISVVAAHEAAVPRSMVRDLVDALREIERATEEGLTAREAEILRLLRSGHSTAAIAANLDISPVTVRRHISKLMQKAGVSTRDELLNAAA
ncbi:MAG: LuxR C-terminal-related transcriptional regulator [Solirubrobacteraceae bacterium]